MSQVKVGQVWSDNDKRFEGVQRRIKVLEIKDGKAICDSEGRRVRIRIDRFKPTATGYRLEQDVPND